jgi:hypothetical protein
MLNMSLTEEQKSTLELRHKKFRDKHDCDLINMPLERKINADDWQSATGDYSAEISQTIFFF